MYTPEESDFLKEKYDGHNVAELAKALSKSERSIIGKLSRLGIYQKKEYVSKTGERPVTKLELVANLAAQLQCEPDELEGLEKAPKQVLRRLLECFGTIYSA